MNLVKKTSTKPLLASKGLKICRQGKEPSCVLPLSGSTACAHAAPTPLLRTGKKKFILATRMY